MALCSTNCVVDLPRPLVNQCRPQSRNGGISHIIFMACNATISDVMDCQVWADLATNGQVVSTLEVLGQKPKANATRKRTSSCRSEQVIGFDYSVTFQDYNADNTDFTDYDFWNTIQQEYTQFQVGFITCDGYLHGFEPFTPGGNAGTLITNFTIEVSNVIEDDYNGSSYWDGSIEWKSKAEHKPVLVPGILQAIISRDCSSVISSRP